MNMTPGHIMSEGGHGVVREQESCSVPVVADTHEREAETLKYLRDDPRIQLNVSSLGTGDYQIREKIVIERKTATDFVQSIIVQRLFSQCHRLRQLEDPCFLLVEGNPYQADHDMHPRAIRGTLISISVFWCIPILFSTSPEDTVSIFKTIGDQYDRNTKYINQRSFMKKRNLKNMQIHVMQGLPGVGADRARKLLDYFGTVRKVITASKDALTEVNGVGKKTAEKIRRVLDASWT